jgi:hypothetical protein
LERSVGALALGPEHAVLVESCRKLGASVDALVEPDEKLWREWRLLLRLLFEQGRPDSVGGSSGVDEWLAEMKGAES